MRTRYNKRRFRTAIMIFVLLLCMSIGYSYLLTTLNIEGTSNIKANTWDVHWENVNVKSGSVTGDQVPIAAHVMSDTTQVEYSVILKNPGEYYEFTVDAKNAGSLDAMVSIVDTKFYESNGVTQISLPNYLEYEFIYSDGVNIGENHLLPANSSKTLKMTLKFKEDLDESELPSTDKTIVIRQSITYIQADESATTPENDNFERHSWSQIVYNVNNGNADYYNVGDTKTINMGSFGTHTLRVANKSTPADCSTEGFSQTACGFVLEFADVITTRVMNSEETSVGGWPASEIRTFLNSDIYNVLPAELKNGIIDTIVRSDCSLSEGSLKFTSIDKLYLLTTTEVYGLGWNDSVYNLSRQLDYYSLKEVTPDQYSAVRKKYNGEHSTWWFRTVPNLSDTSFAFATFAGRPDFEYANYPQGVSPVFRIG